MHELIKTEQEKEQGSEHLKKFLENIANKLQVEGVPVDSECRIDDDAFKNYYPPAVLARDQQRRISLLLQWQADQQKQDRMGEKLEMLKTAIFHKFLKEDFIVCRSALIDDIDNKIDNVVLEKKTGNIIGAFDEVGDINDSFYKDKREKVLAINTTAGARLRYGLATDPKTRKITPKSVENIPLFYLALPKPYIEQGIKNFQLKATSEYEKKLFAYFISSLLTQIKELDLKIPVLEPERRKKLEIFSRAIQKYSRIK